MHTVDSDDIPAMDWHGVPIDAATCTGCEPGRSCWQAVAARRQPMPAPWRPAADAAPEVHERARARATEVLHG